MRDLQRSEITLEDFLIFSLEVSGRENFKLFCLNITLFNLNNKHRRCTQNELVSLPNSNWAIKNDHGSFSHFQHDFHLKEMHLVNSSWDDLIDILTVPQLEINDPELQEIEDQTNFSWVTDDDGDISK